MTYISQVPNDLITLDANLNPILNLNSNHILNNFFTNVHEVDGDISATNEGGDGQIAEYGETLTVPTVGGSSTSGAYIGPVTIGTTNVTIGIPLLAGINVKVNPVEGHLMQGSDGSAYFISDHPMDKDHLGVEVNVTVLRFPIRLLDVPLSDLTNALANEIAKLPGGFLIAGAVRGATGLAQDVLDLAVINITPGGDPLSVICFTRGTLILTAQGYIPVEDLECGDEVATRDNGFQQIRWIGSIKLNATALRKHPNLLPIRIRRGAIGKNSPSNDLLVSPQHRVLIRSRIARKIFGVDEVLVAAKQLLQIEGIDIAHDQHEVEYFHFLFDQHEIVDSNGSETESLYTGREALKSVGSAARAEILLLFPELKDPEYVASPARHLASGRLGRRLAVRHAHNDKPLVN